MNLNLHNVPPEQHLLLNHFPSFSCFANESIPSKLWFCIYGWLIMYIIKRGETIDGKVVLGLKF